MTATPGGRFFKSPIEAAVRRVLQLRGVPFREQFRIGPYRADFYLPARRLVIECDGAAWHTRPHQRRYDARRDAYMRRLGYRVVRLTGGEIRRSAEAAVAKALRRSTSWKPSIKPALPPLVVVRAPRLRQGEEA